MVARLIQIVMFKVNIVYLSVYSSLITSFSTVLECRKVGLLTHQIRLKAGCYLETLLWMNSWMEDTDYFSPVNALSAGALKL